MRSLRWDVLKSVAPFSAHPVEPGAPWTGPWARRPIGNESVPTQFAQCWFPIGWQSPMLKYKACTFQIKYTEAILSNITRKLLWFKVAKCWFVLFRPIIIFAMLSFPINENSRGRQWAFYGHHKDSAVRRKIENNTNIGRHTKLCRNGGDYSAPRTPSGFRIIFNHSRVCPPSYWASLVPNYVYVINNASWLRHKCVHNLPTVVTWKRKGWRLCLWPFGSDWAVQHNNHSASGHTLLLG